VPLFIDLPRRVRLENRGQKGSQVLVGARVVYRVGYGRKEEVFAMQRVNEFFGKEVVRQTSGEKQGNVRDIVFDEGSLNIVALLVGGTIGRGRALRWTSVASVGDVVVVGGEEALGKLGEDLEVADLRKKSHTITGTEIVTQEGEKIGEVRDIFVNERGRVGGYEVSRGMVSDLRGRKFLPMENVQAIGKDTIIVSNPDLLPVAEAEKARG
jgi:uncharacterized protein YrrD